MRGLSILVIFYAFWTLFVSKAGADVWNRQVFPLGERSAFMANSGTGDASDSGAVYYNPAGLVNIESPEVSVTASSYYNYNQNYQSVGTLSSESIPYNVSGFNTVPSEAAAVWQSSNVTFAFSTLVPDSLTLWNQASFTSSDGSNANFIQSATSSDLWLGASAAMRLSDEWSVGFTLWGIHHSEISSVSTLAHIPSSVTPNSLGVGIQRQTLTTNGFSLTGGVFYRPSRWLSVGYRIQSPILQVSGSGDYYNSSDVVESGTVTTVVTDDENFHGTYQLPLDQTLGAQFQVAPRAIWLVDLSYQLGTAYSPIATVSQVTPIDTNATFRVSTGGEIRLSRKVPLRFGFMWNPSSHKDLSTTAIGETKVNLYSATLGVAYRASHVTTGVGGFYIWGNGQNVTGNANTASTGEGDLTSTSVRVPGAMLTTEYVF